MEPELDKTKIAAIKEWLGSGSINIFGKPFAGKDAQGQILSSLFDAPLLGGGDILRNSTIPKHVKAIMEEGELIPTQDYINIVLPYLSQDSFSGKPLILSSVGRWHGEEEAVLGALDKSNHTLKAVVFLDLDEEQVKQRWQLAQKNMDRTGREDDAANTISTRLDVFTRKTLPVLDFYKQKGLLVSVDGRPPKNKVTKQIIDSLYKFTLKN